MELSTKIVDKRLLSSRTIAFLVVSSKVIGLVLFNLHSQGFGFGIGYIDALHYAEGIWLRRKQAETYFHNMSIAVSPKC